MRMVVPSLPVSVTMCLPAPVGLLFCLVLAVSLAGCAARTMEQPSVAYSLEGPRLAVVGEYGDMALEGEMDRTCMVGVGGITLYGKDRSLGFVCEGRLNAEPSDKGRVRGVLDCTGGQVMVFSLRNLGPDQGVGIGRVVDRPGNMVVFYHASREEAERRFPQVKRDIAEAKKVVGG